MAHVDSGYGSEVRLSVPWVRTVVAVQLYVLAAYLAAAIIPYLWAPRQYPPTWLWVVPGLLLGSPGYYITVWGASLAVPLALIGAAASGWAGLRHTVPPRLFRWSLTTAALTAVYALFTLTSLGHDIAMFVAD
ncbi:hypothetical protein ACWT_4969 [Actinoplanes sp. SE50]|uniref:hypothetical protein n=1 Tax=unclassified Actinoplanes TaxID=2626549 RepID=UPI00023ECB66|nr:MULTISPECIES: hypothetical protein [unclassified Actinoplanes]AEV85986.1 hypothetical protein ACPL_5099 [Actinoplanes sp. SE50/110]ATO84384.1 hypothetical protein ACWT_4969 [Actinoplanes sp. SE50]SLM01794.1 hypothetical protein ACSP50_5032 [Actinoplanes sp. SE50/110]